MSTSIRILIADDHPLFRGGLRALLESVSDTEVIGEATSGHEAVELTRTLTPDVVVMDINMPDLNGIEATRQIVQETPDVHVLVMTMHEDDESVFAALRAGARGYQLKGAAQTETLRAIRAVANGEAILGPGVAARLQRYLTAPPTADPGDSFPQLTERELEVLHLLAQRRSNAEIAAQPLPQPEDRPQLRLRDPRQAPGRRSRRGAPRGPRRRARRHDHVGHGTSSVSLLGSVAVPRTLRVPAALTALALGVWIVSAFAIQGMMAMEGPGSMGSFLWLWVAMSAAMMLPSLVPAAPAASRASSTTSADLSQEP